MSLLAAAQGGDEHAFVQLTSPHRRALHVHGYRMLGNLHDADEAVQETLFRAWRALPRYEPRAALSTWLHRIATNVALRMIEQRGPLDLQPYPDRYVDELPSAEGQALARERLGLAYVAAMQVLLSDDVVLTMPPMGLRFDGAVAVGEFFATQPAEGRLERITHTVTRAASQPTLAGYIDGEAYGVMVFALRGDRIAGITGFPHDLDLFRRLGLPVSAPGSPAGGADPARSRAASRAPSAARRRA